MCTGAGRRSHLVPVAALMLFLAGLSPATAHPPGPSTLRTSPDGKRLYVLTTDGPAVRRRVLSHGPVGRSPEGL